MPRQTKTLTLLQIAGHIDAGDPEYYTGVRRARLEAAWECLSQVERVAIERHIFHSLFDEESSDETNLPTAIPRCRSAFHDTWPALRCKLIACGILTDDQAEIEFEKTDWSELRSIILSSDMEAVDDAGPIDWWQYDCHIRDHIVGQSADLSWLDADQRNFLMSYAEYRLNSSQKSTPPDISGIDWPNLHSALRASGLAFSKKKKNRSVSDPSELSKYHWRRIRWEIAVAGQRPLGPYDEERLIVLMQSIGLAPISGKEFGRTKVLAEIPLKSASSQDPTRAPNPHWRGTYSQKKADDAASFMRNNEPNEFKRIYKRFELICARGTRRNTEREVAGAKDTEAFLKSSFDRKHIELKKEAFDAQAAAGTHRRKALLGVNRIKRLINKSTAPDDLLSFCQLFLGDMYDRDIRAGDPSDNELFREMRETSLAHAFLQLIKDVTRQPNSAVAMSLKAQLIASPELRRLNRWKRVFWKKKPPLWVNLRKRHQAA